MQERYELEAKKIAYRAHAGQMRKSSNDPFINHPIAVTTVLKELTDNDNILTIGWLHDVVEDTSYTMEDLYDFPTEVLIGLGYETEDKSKAWKDRKTEQLEKFRNIPKIHENILMVTFADKISNLRDLYKLYNSKGIDHMFDDFNNKDPKEQLWYYSSFYEIFKDHKHLFNDKLMNEYEELLNTIFKEV